MIDTHTHLYSSRYAGEGAAAVQRAIESGVGHMVFPNTDCASIGPLLELHRQFAEHTSVAMGLHPTDITDAWEADLEQMARVLDSEKCVAVGEVGIDLYWDRSRLAEQKEVFARQLHMALERGLPVIIHSRDALEETLEVLQNVKEEAGRLPDVVFHSFTGSAADVRRIREVTDAMFGINGVVTFKNAPELHGAVPEIGIGRLLLETDSPYLAPVPHRGKCNESAYIVHVRDRVAELLGVDPQAVEETTDANARRFFNLH